MADNRLSAVQGNPYRLDEAIGGLEDLPSRVTVLSQLNRLIKRGHPVVLLYGLPGSGKSWLLYQLTKELTEYLAIRFDGAAEVEGADALSTRALHAIGAQVGLAEDRRDLASVRDALGAGGRRILVILSGVSGSDLVGTRSTEHIAAWVLLTQLVAGLQVLVSVEGSVEAVAAPGVASLPSLMIRSLTLSETDTVLSTSAEARLAYDFDAVRRIWELSGGWPGIVSRFGQALFASEAGVKRVRLHDVELALPNVLHLSEPLFGDVWHHLSVAARMALLAASDLRGRHGVFTGKELLIATRSGQLKVDATDLPGVLTELVATGAACRLGSDSFSFCTELFRRWVVSGQSDASRDDRPRPQRTQSSQGMLSRLDWRSVALSMVGILMLLGVTVLWRGRDSGAQTGDRGTPIASTAVPTHASTVPTGVPIGRIVCMARADSDGRWAVWVMRGDGLDPERLTDERTNDMLPSWSPDAKRIIFVSERDGNKEIYAMKADGSEQINLTRNGAEDWTPSWSPDGKSVAFSSYRDANWEIYVMNSDGSNPRRLTKSAGADYSPSWSPDGSRIAFNSNRDGNWEIYAIDAAAGANVQRLTRDEATDTTPAWSPDGTQIAFESFRDGDMELYMMSASGASVRNLTNEHLSNELGPAWAAGGERILFHSNRDGGWDLYSMRLDGTGRTNLTLSSSLEQNPSWHE